MSEPENQLMNVRLEKLQRLRDAGVDPYPHSVRPDAFTSRQAIDLLEEAEADHEGEGDARSETVSVGGTHRPVPRDGTRDVRRYPGRRRERYNCSFAATTSVKATPR